MPTLTAVEIAAGYRLYDDRSIERLTFIARAKQLGCTLEEITDLGDAWDTNECAPIKHRLRALVAAKLADTKRASPNSPPSPTTCAAPPGLEFAPLDDPATTPAAACAGPSAPSPSPDHQSSEALMTDRTTKQCFGALGACPAACAACCAGPVIVFLAAVSIGTLVGVALLGILGLAVAAIALVVYLRRQRAHGPDVAAHEPVAVALGRKPDAFLLPFPDATYVRTELESFAVDEKRCCQFWGFDIVEEPDGVALRWDGPAQSRGCPTSCRPSSALMRPPRCSKGSCEPASTARHRTARRLRRPGPFAALAFAAFDVAEVAHQLDESASGLAALAAVVARHLATAGIAARGATQPAS